jgi:hypothetical protein
MAAELIKGLPIAKVIREELVKDVEALKAKGIQPKLAVLLVGDDEASVVYAQSKEKVGAGLGIEVELKVMAADTSQETVLNQIQGWNMDPNVHGILVELPLPKHIQKEVVMEAISPKKDVDGVHPVNRGYLLGGQEHLALVPATPLSCIALMERAGINLRGKKVTLVGRGDTVGRPLASLLIKRDATITVCQGLRLTASVPRASLSSSPVTSSRRAAGHGPFASAPWSRTVAAALSADELCTTRYSGPCSSCPKRSTRTCSGCALASGIGSQPAVASARNNGIYRRYSGRRGSICAGSLTLPEPGQTPYRRLRCSPRSRASHGVSGWK